MEVRSGKVGDVSPAGLPAAWHTGEHERVEDRASKGRWHLLILRVLPQLCCVMWGSLLSASFECVQGKGRNDEVPRKLVTEKREVRRCLDHKLHA